MWVEFSAVRTHLYFGYAGLRCGLGSRRISLRTVTSRPCLRVGTYSIRVARRWQARHGRGSPGGRLAHPRLDGVPRTGAVRSPPPPAAASAPSRPRGACGDIVARGGVGAPRGRVGRPLHVPPVPPSGDAGKDGDEDQDRGHEDQQRPLLDEQVKHRTAAARATAHLVSSAVGGGPGSPGGVDAVIVPGGTVGSGDVRQRVADARFERRSSGGRGARRWGDPGGGRAPHLGGAPTPPAAVIIYSVHLTTSLVASPRSATAPT